MNRHDTHKKKENHPWFCFLFSFFFGGIWSVSDTFQLATIHQTSGGKRGGVGGGENVGGTNQATTTSNIKCVWSGHSAQIKNKGSAPGVSVRDFFLSFCRAAVVSAALVANHWYCGHPRRGREQISRSGLTSPMGGGQEGGAMHQHWPDLWFSPSASFLS